MQVPDKYDEFDRRVRSRAHSSSESCADEEEEEYSLDQVPKSPLFSLALAMIQ